MTFSSFNGFGNFARHSSAVEVFVSLFRTVDVNGLEKACKLTIFVAKGDPVDFDSNER